MEPKKTIKIAIVANRLTPHWVKRSVAFVLSRLIYYLPLKHRLIAIHNLTRAFPEKSLDEIIGIVKASTANFVLSMLEFPDLLNVNKANIHRLVSVRGLEHYEAACREGKGVLLFSAHFGSWEVGNAALAILSMKGSSLIISDARPARQRVSPFWRCIPEQQFCRYSQPACPTANT